ncbi:MAG: cytochrome c [Deltaproteobacteria bacterium]|nr:cytochrome c [Deltaproteobacteria bacterium]
MRAIVLALLLVGCGDPGEACTEAPTYSENVAPIVARSCLSCHSVDVRGANRQGAPLEANYDTYEMTSAAAEKIVTRVAESKQQMPPRTSSAPKLSQDEVTLVARWRSCGMPP